MKIYYTTQFKRDFKRIRKRVKDINKLKSFIEILLENKELPSKYKDHQLSGKYKNHRDCHIEPDWVLI